MVYDINSNRHILSCGMFFAIIFCHEKQIILQSQLNDINKRLDELTAQETQEN